MFWLLDVHVSRPSSSHMLVHLCLQAAVEVPSFAAAAHPVTVGEFRSFVLEQHGYDRCALWDPSDFKHFKKAGQRHPATWTVKVSTPLYFLTEHQVVSSRVLSIHSCPLAR